MATRPLAGTTGWTIQAVAASSTGRRRRGVTAGVDRPTIPPMFLQSDAVSVEQVLIARPPARTERRAAPPELALETDLKPGESALVAVRHPSGAITFHPSTERAARGIRRGARAAGVAQFRIPIRQTGEDTSTGRRGALINAVKVVVLKVAKAAVDKAVRVALPVLAVAVEKRIWARLNLQEGWFRIAPTAGPSPSLRLQAGVPDADQRTLLLIHGTFSNAASAFRDL